ncbi:hypothetical protein OROHE_000168 [Orobanche hederae]
MTKDLALIIHGSKLTRDHYLNTEEFIDTVADDLKARLFSLVVMEYALESMYHVLKRYSDMNQKMPLIYVKFYTYEDKFCRFSEAWPVCILLLGCARDLMPQNVLVKICDFGSANSISKWYIFAFCPDMVYCLFVFVFIFSELEACAHLFFDGLREPNVRLQNDRPLPPPFNFKQKGLRRETTNSAIGILPGGLCFISWKDLCWLASPLKAFHENPERK